MLSSSKLNGKTQLIHEYETRFGTRLIAFLKPLKPLINATNHQLAGEIQHHYLEKFESADLTYHLNCVIKALQLDSLRSSSSEVDDSADKTIPLSDAFGITPKTDKENDDEYWIQVTKKIKLFLIAEPLKSEKILSQYIDDLEKLQNSPQGAFKGRRRITVFRFIRFNKEITDAASRLQNANEAIINEWQAALQSNPLHRSDSWHTNNFFIIPRESHEQFLAETNTATVSFSQKHPKIALASKIVGGFVAAGAIAAAIVFTGGLAAIPFVGAVVLNLGLPAAVALTTVAVIAVTNMVAGITYGIRKGFAKFISKFKNDKPANTDKLPAAVPPTQSSSAYVISNPAIAAAQANQTQVSTTQHTPAPNTGTSTTSTNTPPSPADGQKTGNPDGTNFIPRTH
jgi:hypothetical protein